MPMIHSNNQRPQMDGISTWAQNRHFLDNIRDDKLDEIRDEIIDKLFGSTKSLLEHCIHRSNCTLCISPFSDEQQRILNELLVNLVEPKYDTKLSLQHLPDDCLSHTMSFLSNFEKGTVQHCSRAMLIAVRRPSSCCDPSNIEMNLFQLIGPCVYRNQIANLILSEDTNDNLAAIVLFNQYTKDHDFGHIKLGRELRRYSKSVHIKLSNILIEHIANPECQWCVLGLMEDFDKYTMLCPAIEYILDHDDEYDDESIKKLVLKKLGSFTRPYSSYSPGVIFDILHCNGLLQSIVTYKPPYMSNNSTWLRAIRGLLLTKYEIIPIRMLTLGIVEEFEIALTSDCMGDQDASKISYLFELLCSFKLDSFWFYDAIWYPEVMEQIETRFDRPLSNELIKEVRKVTKKKEKQSDIDNILYAVRSNYVYTALRPMTHERLMDYKPQILEYFEKYKMSSNDLKKMKRKRFANKLSVYLGNEKLTGSLCLLYNALKELVDVAVHHSHQRQIEQETVIANKASDGSVGGQKEFQTGTGRDYFAQRKFLSNMTKSRIKEGAYCRLKGLLRVPKLNGKTVKIVGYVEEKARWKVKLLHAKREKKYLGVREKNLDPILDWELIVALLTNEKESQKINPSLGDIVTTKKGRIGRVKYIGHVEFTEGSMIGLELLQWDPNGHNGTVNGKKYFECMDGRGYFVKVEDLISKTLNAFSLHSVDGLQKELLMHKDSAVVKKKPNVNEFRYYNNKQMKLHQKYRMNKKFKYNRW